MKSNSKNNLQNQDSECKIFVGGLTWNTTKEMLYNEFSKYGEIVDSIVMKNPETGNSRGFGFVTYKENSSAENAVATNSHKIDGKIVDVKLCNPRLAAQQRNTKQKCDNCKIFVGGLPHGVTDDQITQFFSRYGPVKEFKMMYDENKQRPRGFGFITFELEENANQVLQEHYIQFNGKQIEVKPQIHNLKQQIPYQQQQMQFQQGYFNTGNWNTNWNQQQPGQGINPNTNSFGQIVPGGFNPSMQNPGAVNQHWGYQGHPVQFPNGVPNNNQSNWNYQQYYGQQQQQGYFPPIDTSGTGIVFTNQVPPPQQQQQQQPNEQIINTQLLQPNQNQQSVIVTTSPDSKPKTHYNEAMLLTSDYLHDSAFLPTSNYKQSSSSSIAGTIGSNANYSDSEASSHSYYRGNSLGSNSSIAPSVSSLTSSSIISNISGNSSNSSSSTTSSNSHGYSNQNHHRINTQQAMASNPNNPERNRNHHHGHNRSGGSIASSSATDISSVYSSVQSQSNAVNNIAGMNDDILYSGLILPEQHQPQGQDQRSYHPYRR